MIVSFLIWMATTTTSNAQELEYDCAELISYREVDGGWVLQSETIVLAHENNRRSIGMMLVTPQEKDVLMFSFEVRGVGCISEGALIEIEFSDLSTMELYTDNPYNCKGYAYVLFGDAFDRGIEYLKLKRKDISKIRFHGNGGVIEREVSEEDALYLQACFACMF